MASCCAPVALYAPPTQNTVSFLSQPFTSHASSSVYVAGQSPPYIMTDFLVFSLTCESTVTLSLNGSMTYTAPAPQEPQPFFVSIFVATAFAQTSAIVPASNSAQTFLGVPGLTTDSAPIKEAINLNGTTVLPPGTYIATVQFENQFVSSPNQLPTGAALYASGTMSATIIKTRA